MAGVSSTAASMTRNMQVRVLAVLLAGVAWCVQGHMTGDCGPPSADYGILAACGAFHISTVGEATGITPDTVTAALAEYATDITAGMTAAFEDLMYDQMGDGPDEDGVMMATKAPVAADASAVSAALITNVYNYYSLVCPRRYYWLSTSQWTFYMGSNTYCWPYVNIWVTACSRPYCAWWFTNPYLMYYYYRCAPVYRVIHVWSRCFTYVPGTSIQWDNYNRYIRVYVPKDCCCRRYLNPWITAATCEAL